MCTEKDSRGSKYLLDTAGYAYRNAIVEYEKNLAFNKWLVDEVEKVCFTESKRLIDATAVVKREEIDFYNSRATLETELYELELRPVIWDDWYNALYAKPQGRYAAGGCNDYTDSSKDAGDLLKNCPSQHYRDFDYEECYDVYDGTKQTVGGKALCHSWRAGLMDWTLLAHQVVLPRRWK